MVSAGCEVGACGEGRPRPHPRPALGRFLPGRSLHSSRFLGSCRLHTPRPGPVARACLQSRPRAGRAAQGARLRAVAGGGRAGGLGSGIPRSQGALPDRCSSVLGRSASMNPFVATLCLCLGVVLGAPSLDPELDDHWELWKSWHKKDYHEVSPRGTRSAGRVLSSRAGPHQLSHVCFVTTPAMGSAWGSIILLFPGSFPVFVYWLSCTVLVVFLMTAAEGPPLDTVHASHSSSLRLPEYC